MDILAKKKLLEEIKREVEDLHPLLENVLPKMTGVRNYEYTHGVWERGADFVLEIENQTTKRIDYIGVVAKCKKIGGGDVPDIEEQIRECAEERPYKAAKKVRCAQIWVICPQGYTERAKEKIQNRFPERSLTFFASEDLLRFVDEYYPYFWEKLPKEVGGYFQMLSIKMQLMDQATSLLTLQAEDDYYIELDAFERVRKKYPNQQQTRPEIKNVDFYAVALESKISVLEAEMGFGKSRMLRRLVRKLASAEVYEKKKILPIYSTFKNFMEVHGGKIDELVSGTFPHQDFLDENPEVHIFIILDGIDECIGGQYQISDLFDSTVDQINSMKNFRLLISTRPLRALEDRAAIYEGGRTFGIRPMSLGKLIKFIEGLLKNANLPNRLYEDLKRSHLFQQLPQSPIAAVLFSNLLAEKQNDIPQNLTELYAKSVDLMLGRWEQKKQLSTEKQFTTALLVAEHLATYFVENKLIYVSLIEAKEMVRAYLSVRNTGVPVDEVEALLFERSNLFNVDVDENSLSFRHRSFGEFLCAKRKDRERSLNVEEVALDPFYSNILFFYAGLRMDCPELLDELHHIQAKTEQEEWMKAIAVPNYLLAAHQTEFSAIEQNIKVVLFDVARLYVRIKSGNSSTRLGELPEMHLLYLFKGLVEETLAYDFFKPAFEGVALSISESLDEEIKVLSLFFLACASDKLGNGDLFEYLVKDIGAERLPLSIGLALKVEMEGSTNIHKFGLIKLHRDKLHRLLRGGRTKVEGIGVQQKLKDLYRRPIGGKKNPA